MIKKILLKRIARDEGHASSHEQLLGWRRPHFNVGSSSVDSQEAGLDRKGGFSDLEVPARLGGGPEGWGEAERVSAQQRTRTVPWTWVARSTYGA